MNGEFQIIIDTPQGVQKLINTWRHQFTIIIHTVISLDNEGKRLLACIERKREQDEKAKNL